MFGRREAGVLGATVVLAGGVAYLIWNYASSSGEKKPETRPEKDGKSAREEGEGEGKEEERKEEPVVVVAAAAPVVGATAQKAPEVKNLNFPGHTFLDTFAFYVLTKKKNRRRRDIHVRTLHLK